MPLSPSNGLPRPFVEVVKGDLRNNFHGSDRACEANSACNDKADHEGIHRPRNAPLTAFKNDRVCASPLSKNPTRVLLLRKDEKWSRTAGRSPRKPPRGQASC
jgi:hypothetical protein